MSNQTDAYLDPTGLWRWKSNDRIPFDDMLQSWGVSGALLERHQGQRDLDNKRFIGQYRKSMAEMEKDEAWVAEHTASLRGAFGPGHRVVNIITGRTYQT